MTENNQYKNIAAMLTALGFEFDGNAIESHHIAVIQICLELFHVSSDQNNSWTNIAKYVEQGQQAQNLIEQDTQNNVVQLKPSEPKAVLKLRDVEGDAWFAFDNGFVGMGETPEDAKVDMLDDMQHRMSVTTDDLVNGELCAVEVAWDE